MKETDYYKEVEKHRKVNPKQHMLRHAMCMLTDYKQDEIMMKRIKNTIDQQVSYQQSMGKGLIEKVPLKPVGVMNR